MEFIKTPFEGLVQIKPTIYSDERGGFFRYVCHNEFENAGLNAHFVQMNQSINHNKGTLRGMHYQEPPHAEEKLVRCIKGAVQDIVVDLRKDSPTFLKYYSITLSEQNRIAIYIPKGFAHGFITLENNTELIYHHTAFYNPTSERGIQYNDPQLNITWPIMPEVISERDLNHSLLSTNFNGLAI